MSTFHHIQSYHPAGLGEHKFGLLQIMLDTLPGTPTDLKEWVDSLYWDSTANIWQQKMAPPRWQMKVQDRFIQVQPMVVNVKSENSQPWLEISLLLNSEDIKADTLSGYNPTLLPILEKLAVAMYKVLRPKELFLINGKSESAPWKALQKQDKLRKWDFDIAVLSKDSDFDLSELPSEYENRKLDKNFQVIRSKWVSFDLRKGRGSHKN